MWQSWRRPFLFSTPTFSGILHQARGEKVEVVLQQAAAQPGTLTGSIIGIEKQRQAVGKDAVAEVECLTLWCADGMRSVKLSEVQRVRFLNAVMDSEFKKALETLALGHDAQKKSVSLHFAGEGRRRVRVGYVVENPVWKTSYRLALPKQHDDKDRKAGGQDREKAKDRPYLQGWAVVENVTDEDWSGVRLALISGRPISFQMNLYDALFVKRPVVEPELFASLRPPSYSGGLGIATGVGGAAGTPPMEQKAQLGGLAPDKEMDRAEAERGRQLGYFAQPSGRTYAYDVRKRLNEGLDLGASVASAASASRLGDYFQYAVDHPVTLPRQKSALLPIVGTDVRGQRVSIYNEWTHPKFPLLGLVFRNTTGMNLTQGPVTVYEGSTYAGDARLPDLQKGERRLLSYAIDLGTEVHAVPHADNGRLTSVKLVKGVLHTTTKVRESKTYTVVNRGDADRVVMVEHPHRTDFQLTTKEKPWETASDVHRFKFDVPAGKTVPLTVTEEKEFGSQVALTNSDDHAVQVLINDRATTAKVREALARALELRGKLAATQREIGQLERQLRGITEDQTRLRANLREMPPQAEAYKRYLKKFDQQETDIEKLQAQIKRLQDGEHAQRKDYEDFLANLTIE